MRIDNFGIENVQCEPPFAAALERPTGTPCDEVDAARTAVDNHTNACPVSGDVDEDKIPRRAAPLLSRWNAEHQRLEAVLAAKEKACDDYNKHKKD